VTDWDQIRDAATRYRHAMFILKFCEDAVVRYRAILPKMMCISVAEETVAAFEKIIKTRV
jgi:hypothetical protein